ncbi:RNA 2',3'-cyclic phosphodiesterase [Gudongella sp. DL1XJH-153]|uniref:RNA 2',3'-cyclic phosphodiesterase n=1 Tax=Gudongella sp. DL1XJH-153 TaxID=3409804 RepID=UPI003BB4B5C8
MRLFICIELEEEQLDVVEKAKERLKIESRKGRFVKSEHTHLTLVFIGEVEDHRLDDVIQAIEKISFKEFQLHMSGLGWFQKRSGKIYWIGFERNEELLRLQKDLQGELKDQGFNLEKREYTPHVTIGRNVKVKEDFNPSTYTELIQGRCTRVKEIVLKKSENQDRKMIHTRLYSKSAKNKSEEERN